MPKGKVQRRKHIPRRVIHFSGGLSSALMTIMLKPGLDDKVIFTDTGREHAATYKFIDDFQRNEGIEIIKLQNKESFSQLVERKGMVPYRAMRFCTQELKIRCSRRYLRSIGWDSYTQFIGFRYDEKQRIESYGNHFVKVNTEFPLNAAGVTKEAVNHYWKQKHYTLEIPSILGNCDLCFMKGAAVIIRILQVYPELAAKWIKDECIAGGTFIKGISYTEMLDIAKRTQSLFPLQDFTPQYNCSCTI